jgi:hypothetical protein
VGAVVGGGGGRGVGVSRGVVRTAVVGIIHMVHASVVTVNPEGTYSVGRGRPVIGHCSVMV